jgi:hypothetical protein
MNSHDVQIDIREYDILLYGGMPRVPDPVYGQEQNTYREVSSVRPRPKLSLCQPDDAKVISWMVFNFETGEISIESVH